MIPLRTPEKSNRQNEFFNCRLRDLRLVVCATSYVPLQNKVFTPERYR